MKTDKIIVPAPVNVQRRCLEIANGKTPDQIKGIIKNLQDSSKGAGPEKIASYQHLKCYKAYLKGWRGNFADMDDALDCEPEGAASEEVQQGSQADSESAVDCDEPKEEYPTDKQVATKFLRLMKSAEQRDKDFNLSLKEVKRLMKLKRCQLTGVELTNCKGPDFVCDTDRTIDRIDASQGYVVGNVIAVSRRANHLKNELFERVDSVVYSDIDTIERLIAGMRKFGC